MTKKVAKIEPKPDVSPADPPEQSAQQLEQQQGIRVEALLEGKVPPPNEFAKYLIEKGRETRDNLRGLERTIVEMERKLAQYRQNLLRLQGSFTRSIEDIKNWDKPGPRTPVVGGPVEEASKKLEAVPEIEEEAPKEPDPEPAV